MDETQDSEDACWTSYDPTAKQERRAQSILNSFDQDFLIEACRKKRSDCEVDCEIPNHWSMGSRNLVLEARFSDGVRWALKIFMLSCQSDDFSSNTSSNIVSYEGRSEPITSTHTEDSPEENESDIYENFEMESEAMEFLRSNTAFPVPTSHLLIRLPSSLGVTACLAMDFVEGVKGSVFFDEACKDYEPLVQEKFRLAQDRVLASMAQIQVTLAQFQMPVGGALRRASCSHSEPTLVDGFAVKSTDSQNDSFCRTPRDFYRSMLNRRLENLAAAEDLEYAASSRKILQIISDNLQNLCGKDSMFYLTNLDLGGHNTIFDQFGSLKAIIDVDSLQFVPIEYAAQPPAEVGLEYFTDCGDTAWRGDESEASFLRKYASMLAQAGQDCGQHELGKYFASQMLSDGAVLVGGFQVVDDDDAIYNNDFLHSELVSRLTKPIPGSLLLFSSRTTH